jgi:hypothetical protein
MAVTTTRKTMIATTTRMTTTPNMVSPTTNIMMIMVTTRSMEAMITMVVKISMLIKAMTITMVERKVTTAKIMVVMRMVGTVMVNLMEVVTKQAANEDNHTQYNVASHDLANITLMRVQGTNK